MSDSVHGQGPAAALTGPRASGSSPALGHRPVIPPRIGARAEPVPDHLLRRYREAAVPDISDAVGRLYTMHSGLRPLYEPMRRIVGAALTVKAPPEDNWAIHAALSLVEGGDVLVVDWQGYTEGCGTGVNSLIRPIRQGLAGVVVDGGWRDIVDLQAIDFPITGRAISAFSPGKREFGEINVPICCGGVIVEAGDVVVADREGAVVVPRRHVGGVAAALPEYIPRKSLEEYPPAEGTSRAASAYMDAFNGQG